MDCLTPGGDISYHVEVVGFLRCGAGIVRTENSDRTIRGAKVGFYVEFPLIFNSHILYSFNNSNYNQNGSFLGS